METQPRNETMGDNAPGFATKEDTISAAEQNRERAAGFNNGQIPMKKR